MQLTAGQWTQITNKQKEIFLVMIFLSFVGSLRANTTDHYLWSPSSLRLLNPSRNSTRIPNIPPQYLAGRLFSLTEIISSKSWGEMMMITMIIMTKSWWERIKNKERSVVVHVFSDIVFAIRCLCHSTQSLVMMMIMMTKMIMMIIILFKIIIIVAGKEQRRYLMKTYYDFMTLWLKVPNNDES